MTRQKVCFVISPIGDEGSSTRTNADDVFDLLIQPAVEPFGLSVVRADKIPGPNSINEEVIRLVQESELCIADLTERNPNVFYECGRRHETGKPVILIIRKGEKIPFDLAGIRTIAYDLSDTRRARESVKTVQAFLSELEKSGFAESASGATLASVMDMLARIERKVTNIGANAMGATPSAPTWNSSSNPVPDMLRNPATVFQEAILSGDIQTIVALIPRIERMQGHSRQLITAAAMAAINGEESGFELLTRAIESDDPKLKPDDYKAAMAAVVQYHIATERSTSGAQRVTHLAQRILGVPSMTDLDRAHVNNQMQMFFYDANQFQEALHYAEEAIRLDPTETAYLVNLSMVYESLKLPRKALEAIEKALELGSSSAHHLGQAFDVFVANGLHDKAQSALEALQKLDPQRAARKRWEEQMRSRSDS